VRLTPIENPKGLVAKFAYWMIKLENYYTLLNLPLGIESDGLCAIAQRRAV